jgi:predicted nucleic acid-binding protein
MNLLDTSAVVEMVRQKTFRPGIISSVTLFEVLRGIEDEKRPRAKALLEESFRVLNFDNSIVEAYCVLYRKLKKEGALLPDADLLIAATAIAHDLILVTDDEHFLKLKKLGLRLE